MSTRKYDSTVARIAGNIMSGFVSRLEIESDGTTRAAAICVQLAREIIAETLRTEPLAALQETPK